MRLHVVQIHTRYIIKALKWRKNQLYTLYLAPFFYWVPIVLRLQKMYWIFNQYFQSRTKTLVVNINASNALANTYFLLPLRDSIHVNSTIFFQLKKDQVKGTRGSLDIFKASNVKILKTFTSCYCKRNKVYYTETIKQTYDYIVVLTSNWQKGKNECYFAYLMFPINTDDF